MNRRDFMLRSSSIAAAAATATLPALAAEAPAPGSPAAFDAAAARQPLVGAMKGVDAAAPDLDCAALKLDGRWPAALQGRFLRNGPALHERGGQRYHHWFDGDGMVQQFRIGAGQVAHTGRLVRTPKLMAEQRAGRFVYTAFGTPVEGGPPAQGPDTFNTANTNALEHAGRVLAMWEGGSAFALDPKDLSTTGVVTWKEGYEQVPFSAHPKRDAQGTLWNIGTSGARLIAWQIDARGQLAKVQVGAHPYPGGMAHDMAITPQHLVVPLAPVKLNIGQSDPARGFPFDAAEPLRILVMRKDDISQRRVFELPAQMVFHIGNAFERTDGSVALSFIGAADAGFLRTGATGLMRGELVDTPFGSTQLAELDMRSGRARVQSLADGVEFPRIDPRRIGEPAQQLLSGASWVAYPGRRGPLLHGVQLRDLDTGAVQRFDYGAHAVVEEHVLVPKPGGTDELDAWLLGTTFDAQQQRTVLNVLDARHVADGPIAQATLPYALPLGFHGNFTAA